MKHNIVLVDANGTVVYVSTIETPEGKTLKEILPIQNENVKLLDLGEIKTYDSEEFGPIVNGDIWNGKNFIHASFEHIENPLIKQWHEEAVEVARENAINTT